MAPPCNLRASGNTVGGTATGAANAIGFNTTAGIAILARLAECGPRQHLFRDRRLGVRRPRWPPATSGSPWGPTTACNPRLVAASLSSDGSTLGLALAAPATAAAVLDVYVEGAARRTFLGEVTLAVGATSTSLAVAGSVVTSSSRIIATQTIAADGTSAFSAPQPVATQSTVTNTNPSGPGSLAAAIAAADPGGTTDIIFRILGTGPFIIPWPPRC